MQRDEKSVLGSAIFMRFTRPDETTWNSPGDGQPRVLTVAKAISRGGDGKQRPSGSLLTARYLFDGCKRANARVRASTGREVPRLVA